MHRMHHSKEQAAPPSPPLKSRPEPGCAPSKAFTEHTDQGPNPSHAAEVREQKSNIEGPLGDQFPTAGCNSQPNRLPYTCLLTSQSCYRQWALLPGKHEWKLQPVYTQVSPVRVNGAYSCVNTDRECNLSTQKSALL